MIGINHPKMTIQRKTNDFIQWNPPTYGFTVELTVISNLKFLKFCFAFT